jgi:hypothetical protein
MRLASMIFAMAFAGSALAQSVDTKTAPPGNHIKSYHFGHKMFDLNAENGGCIIGSIAIYGSDETMMLFNVPAGQDYPAGCSKTTGSSK